MKQENNNRFKMLCVCVAIACIAIIAVMIIGVTIAKSMKNNSIKDQQELPYLYDSQVDKESDYYFNKTINKGKLKFLHYGQCDNKERVD
jgi:hypothetical protein